MYLYFYIPYSVLIISHSHTWSCLSKRLNLQGAPFSSLSVSSSSLRFGAAILLLRISPLSFCFSVYFFFLILCLFFTFFSSEKTWQQNNNTDHNLGHASTSKMMQREHIFISKITKDICRNSSKFCHDWYGTENVT